MMVFKEDTELKNFADRVGRSNALQRIVTQDREIILDLREKLARAEQDRDAAVAEVRSMQSDVTVSYVSAMLG